jgi:hypothetical protein
MFLKFLVITYMYLCFFNRWIPSKAKKEGVDEMISKYDGMFLFLKMLFPIKYSSWSWAFYISHVTSEMILFAFKD